FAALDGDLVILAVTAVTALRLPLVGRSLPCRGIGHQRGVALVVVVDARIARQHALVEGPDGLLAGAVQAVARALDGFAIGEDLGLLLIERLLALAQGLALAPLPRLRGHAGAQFVTRQKLAAGPA